MLNTEDYDKKVEAEVVAILTGATNKKKPKKEKKKLKGFMSPSMKKENIVPYQLWFSGLAILWGFLPQKKNLKR